MAKQLTVFVGICWAAVVGIAAAHAQSPTAQSEGMTLFRQAYELTKSAKTEGDFNAIVELCDRGLELQVSDKEADYAKSLLSWTYNKRGEARADAGQEAEALADFDQAIQYDPRRWQALHNRGVSYGMLKQYNEALADFNKVIELKPDHAKAWYNRGELRFRQGNYAAAVADYSQCLRISPRDAVALNSRGFAYYSQGNYRNALADYGQALQIDPQHTEAYINRGDALADQGQYQRAITDYQAAVRINPNYGRAYQSAAWVRATCPVAQFRNAETALTAANKAIELDGDQDYRYLDTLAAAQANAGQFTEAVETQTKAIAAAAAAEVPKPIVDRLEQRLNLYARQQPYREGGPTVAQRRS